MALSQMSFSRRHLLGDLHSKCEQIDENVPVYLSGDENLLLGHADQCLGKYADAVTFHLEDTICKRLSSGQFTFEFDVDRSETKGRIILRSIRLKERQPYEKPLPARRSAS